MTLQRLLCPIDFSDTAAHAIDQAVTLARWYRAHITVLHAYPTVSRVPGLPTPDAVATQVPTPVDLEALRAEVAAFCRPIADAGATFDIVLAAGQPLAAILDQAAALPADVIVMGTHGASGFQHLLLGSVTEKVLRRASCPVLTVPPRAQATSSLPFRRVLCSVDFSDCSLQAVTLAASLARESGAALTLLHVLEWPWHEPPMPTMDGVPPEQARALVEYRHYLESTARSRLEAVGAAGGQPQETAPDVRVRFGKPHGELLAEAREERADLIVMGVRGRNALDIGLFGSTTNQVVRRATCPVLTVGTQ